MDLEVFVRASGSAMGLARDAFGFNAGAGTGLTSTTGSSARLAAAVSGSGQAASAANGESAAIDAQGSALSAQNLAAHAHLDSVVAAAGAGRSQMDSVIAAALADINSLAVATTTPAGQMALVRALAGRLEQTWQALTNGQSDSSTRAASATQLAAAYNGLGNGSVGGLAQTSPMAYMGATSPLGAMSSMQNMSMLTAAQMAASQAAMAGSQAATMQQSTSNSGVQTVSDVTPVGAKVDPISTSTAVSNISSKISVSTGPAAATNYINQSLTLMGITDPTARQHWMTGLLHGMSHESTYAGQTYNPLAINLGDSNVRGAPAPDGHPSNCSRGLLQFVPGTFGSYHQAGTSLNVYDPIANITAGMNRLMKTYGVKSDGSNLATAVKDGDFSSNYHGGGW